MARLARVKAEGDGAFYHLCGRVAGVIGEYPLNDKRCRRKIIDFIRLFAKVYCCKVVGFCVMGNHYHLVVRMGSPRTMTRKELSERANLLYNDTLLDGWLAVTWDRFEASQYKTMSPLFSPRQKHPPHFHRQHPCLLPESRRENISRLPFHLPHADFPSPDAQMQWRCLMLSGALYDIAGYIIHYRKHTWLSLVRLKPLSPLPLTLQPPVQLSCGYTTGTPHLQRRRPAVKGGQRCISQLLRNPRSESML